MKPISIGTAGWSIPRELAEQFPGEGLHLERYARHVSCVEINSSFHRDHPFETYAKWSAQTPASFRFSVKLPRVITHDQALRRARVPLRTFLSQVTGLGRKLGPLLIQLPPSGEFDRRAAQSFFAMLRDEHEGPVVCEPRHPSWFESAADAVLIRFRIARVAADPIRIEAARIPGGWKDSGDRTSLAYYRFHGSPRKYWSRYEHDRLHEWALQIADVARAVPVWCIFDNTASGAALGNALELRALLSRKNDGDKPARRRTRCGT